MNSTDLYNLFRGDVGDANAPYLWSDLEVYTYMNDAYQMFARLTGGVPDFLSAATRIAVVAATQWAAIDASILRVMSAYRVSDNAPVKVINVPDLPNALASADYGEVRSLYLSPVPGPVNYMLLGASHGMVQWLQIPQVNDTVQMSVYRLPTTQITTSGQAFSDIGIQHHLHLLDWMEHLAYKKQDAETFDKARSKEKGDSFTAYCGQAKAEMERFKHKTRVVRYGGI